MATKFGRTEPRLWTLPLRELTPETSLGFEVIEFALVFLGIDLYPWQKWLLIHALELLPDGSYRFRRVIVLVARQNGKTLLGSVLAAWWLFIDSRRHPDQTPPVKFKIVGVAQNLDIAREPWASVKLWCDPEPDSVEEEELAIAELQSETQKVSDTNGKEGIYARSRAHYEIRAGKNVRGKPAARVLMDEIREQQNWVSWNSVSQTTKSFPNGQLWAISNAGDSRSVVLSAQRDGALAVLNAWNQLVETGTLTAEQFAESRDTTIGIFEWSAPPGCPLDDEDGILQANPSVGYGGLTLPTILADLPPSMTDAGYRTEVLCQWVEAKIDSYMDVTEWKAGHVSPFAVQIPPGSRTVWGVDVSSDRRWTWIAAAVEVADGRRFVQVRQRFKSQFTAVDALAKLAKESGWREVALQSRGSPSMELIKPLTEAGLYVHEIDGGTIGLATGRFRDRAREGELIHTVQPLVDLGIEGGLTKRVAENEAWDRHRSIVDIAGVVAETCALYALEALQIEEENRTSAYADHDLMVF